MTVRRIRKYGRKYRRMALVGLLIVLAGCGYSLHPQSALPFHEIAIDTVENRTTEPGLQDILHRALVEEFMRQGIEVTPLSKQRVSAVIRSFDMPSLSEKNDVSREYHITVSVDFTFVGGDGQKTYLKNIGAPFMKPFAASDDMGRLLAAKRIAEEQTLQDVVEQFIGALVYK